jgi:hypothetical protein
LGVERAPEAAAQALARTRAQASPILQRLPSPLIQRMWDKTWAKLDAVEKADVKALYKKDAQKTIEARLPYPSVTVAGLSAELRAGLALAQRHDAADTQLADATAKHAVNMAGADAKQVIRFNKQLAKAKSTHAAVTTPLPDWMSVPAKKPDGKGDWERFGKAREFRTVPLYDAHNVTQYRTQWGSVHNNLSGKLPGKAGDGGYQEYYAEPSGGAANAWHASGGDATKKFGSNRILKQNNVSQTYWWASDDHYTTYKFISDAVPAAP